MKTLKTAILALSVAALPLTAFAQGTAPVDATKPAPSAPMTNGAGANAGVTGNANTGIVPPKAGVTSDTKAGVDGTRADARTGTNATVKPEGKVAADANASGTASGATAGKTDSGKTEPAAKPAEPAKKPEKHSAVHTDRKHVASAKTEKHDVKADTKTGATAR